MLTITPDIGFRDLGQLGDLASAPHRHLQHQYLGPRGRAQYLEGEADLGIEVGAGGHGPPVGGQDGQEEILGRGLAR